MWFSDLVPKIPLIPDNRFITALAVSLSRKSAIGYLLGIRQRGQLSSDCPPAVTNDGAAKGGECADRRLTARAGAPGGFNTAYTTRIAVFPRSVALNGGSPASAWFGCFVASGLWRAATFHLSHV